MHLYAGLFISPLLLAFSLSVFFLVHAWTPGVSIPGSPAPQPSTRSVTGLAVPAGIAQLKGRPQIDALRPVLDALGVHGEVNFVRGIPKENRLVVPVIVPGRETSVDLNIATSSAVITETTSGAWAATIYLHKMPGQHNAAVRGNWFWLQVWKWFADATVWLVLFLTLSGIYLWAVLRAERRVGFALLATGVLSFFGLVYVVIR
jgi:hypothetical protein